MYIHLLITERKEGLKDSDRIRVTLLRDLYRHFLACTFQDTMVSRSEVIQVLPENVVYSNIVIKDVAKINVHTTFSIKSR